MFTETPYPGAWGIDEIIRSLTDYLHRSDVLLIVFTVCAAIALAALLKVLADVRRSKPRQVPTIPEPREATHPFGMAHPPDGSVDFDGNSPAQDLGYSQRGAATKCIWRKDVIQPHPNSVRWLCMACRGFAFTSDGGRPVTCRAYDPKQKL